MQKAFTLDDIDQAVRFNEPIDPDHAFYTDLTGVRGDFEERIVYKILNVKTKGGQFTFDAATNSQNKTLFFLGGMRGSGKTSELAKYVKNMHRPECFFCVTCNIDDELDMNDVEYMDILIFQLEKLGKKLQKNDIPVNKGAIQSLERWFEERIKEINTSIKGEAEMSVGVKSEGGLLGKIIGLFGELKLGISGSKERATSIRTTFKNRFSDFAKKFNNFIEESNVALRKAGKGQEILFVIDGLEKTLSLETRRKIIMEESNRIRQIKVNTIFTLPIELMKERQKIGQFSHIESFPFVKLVEKNGTLVEKAFAVFRDFVYKRIDKALFTDEAIVEKAIQFSGGSPRELLRILETAAFYADEDLEKIDEAAMDKAIKRLAGQTAQFVTEKQFEKLKEIKENNTKGLETPFDDIMQELLENIIVMEYNDGNFKRVNPLVEVSNLYQQRVG